MFYQIFLLPRVKRSLIIINKLVYPSSLRVAERKSWIYNPVSSLPQKKTILTTLAIDSLNLETEFIP